MYYNTTNLTGAELQTERTSAMKQDEAILNLFQNPDFVNGLSPSEAWEILNVRWPITSIRRAINTLTNAGKLEKTPRKRVGVFGKKEHVWRLATNTD